MTTPRRPRVRAIIQIFDASSSRALHVDTDDGEFVIKVTGNPEGPRVLIGEWIGTSLARRIGLSTPDFAIIDVPSAISIPSSAAPHGSLGSAFGSRFEKLQPWGGKSSVGAVTNTEMFSRIVVLDTWLRNVDRYSVSPGGRIRKNDQNLVLSTAGAAKGKFVVKAIDHGHILSGPSWTKSQLSGIAAVKDRAVYGRFPEFEGYLAVAEIRKTLRRARRSNESWLLSMIRQIPFEWGLRSGEAEAVIEFLRARATYLESTLVGMIWPQSEFDF
ncbi:MAG: HipA family kinase [Candidatus Binataceae bacterium]